MWSIVDVADGSLGIWFLIDTCGARRVSNFDMMGAVKFKIG